MMLPKILILPIAKQLAKILWGSFISTSLINTIIAQIEDKFKISKSLMTGEKKLLAVLEALKKLQEVAKAGVNDADLTALVQLFYRVLKLVKKD